jgi:regulator of protease activity HflC (stomatin/prohibitin superfamily)
MTTEKKEAIPGARQNDAAAEPADHLPTGAARCPALPGKRAGLGLGLLVALLGAAVTSGCATVGPGQVGVLWTVSEGTQKTPYGEGLHAVAGWNRMYTYDTRTLSHDEVLKVMTIDGLGVTLNATVRYHIVPQEVVALHQQIGSDYYAKVVAPALRSESRRIAGRYTPEELYSTKRDMLENETYAGLSAQVAGRHFAIEAVLIRSVELPATVRAAIDQKLMAEQEVLKMRSALLITKTAADQRRVEAQGVADYNRTVAASLSAPMLDFERIQQTGKLAASANAKTLIIDSGKHGSPMILSNPQ